MRGPGERQGIRKKENSKGEEEEKGSLFGLVYVFQASSLERAIFVFVEMET